MRYMILLVIISCLSFVNCIDIGSSTSDNSEDEENTGSNLWYEIYKENKIKTVLIKSTYSNGLDAYGSGFFVKNNVIATNSHVVSEVFLDDDNSYITAITVLLSDGTTLDVKGIDYQLKDRDIAFLAVDDQNIVPVQIGSFESIQVLDPILQIGNPLGLNWTVNRGNVSAIRESNEVKDLNSGEYALTWIDTDTEIVQHDISTDMGSSGGPIFNAKGEVVAIVFARYEFSGEFRFGISIDYLSSVIDNLTFITFDDIKEKNKSEEEDNYTYTINCAGSDECERATKILGKFDLFYYENSVLYSLPFLLNSIGETKNSQNEYIVSGYLLLNETPIECSYYNIAETPYYMYSCATESSYSTTYWFNLYFDYSLQNYITGLYFICDEDILPTSGDCLYYSISGTITP